jgi:uncharacterized protein YdaU (DUF1376 family)
MAQFSALPLWTDAYLADTGHLTTIEHGAYLLLLMTMWRADGALPNDDKQLARYVRMTSAQWLRIKPTIMQFFKVSSDSITQGRLTDELAFVKQKSGKQSDNARARWLKTKETSDAGAYAGPPKSDMPNACHSDAPTPTPLEEDKSSSSLSETSSDEMPKKGSRKSYTKAFEAFWNAYPRHSNMSKSEAFKEWQKIDDMERTACVAAVPGYIAYLKTSPISRPCTPVASSASAVSRDTPRLRPLRRYRTT